MTDRVSQLPAAEFAVAWNTAAGLDEVVARVRERVGSVPRWAVLARAAALRKDGVDLKRFAGPLTVGGQQPCAAGSP